MLIKTSIFETIDPDILQELSESEDSSKILQDFSRRNLFLVSVYDQQKGRLFRYHQLFRDFLERKLANELNDKARRALFYKAGSLLEKKGDEEKAIKYYLEAQAFPEAASVIERIGMEFLRIGRTGDLSSWLQMLPKELIQVSAWLLFYLSMTRRYVDLQESAFSLSQAYPIFENQNNVSGQLLSLAYLIEMPVFLSGPEIIPLHDLLLKAEKLLLSLNQSQYLYEKALLYIQIGIVHNYRDMNLEKGLQAFYNAYILANEFGDRTLQINALIFSMQAYTYNGEFPKAKVINLKIEQLIGESVHPELRVFYFMFYTQLLIFCGDLDQAEALCILTHDEAFMDFH